MKTNLEISDLSGSKNFEKALEVIDHLESSGHEAWIVGGFLRDAILERPSSDIDIATSAKWQDVEKVLSANGACIRRTGTAHGTVTVIFKDENGEEDGVTAFEVTTYRIDSPTSSDSRHPDSVTFTDSIIEDLARRDFTMNAMAWHPVRGLLDPFDGLCDIENGTIRIVGDPSARFSEDALRILRACRFASELGFSIDQDTFMNMHSSKYKLLKVSGERIIAELDRLLLGDHVHDAIMSCADVLSICIPEICSMNGCEQRTKYHIYDVLEHTAWAVEHCKKDRLLRWAAFCHDMGKPACSFYDSEGVQHFYGHARVGEKIARSFMQGYPFSKKFIDEVCTLVANHNDEIEPTAKSVRRRLAKLNGDAELMRALIELKRADLLAHAPDIANDTSQISELEERLDEVLASKEAFSISNLPVNGKDIISLGVSEGPGVGHILNTLLNEVIDERLDCDREALLDRARQIAIDAPSVD